MRRIFGEDSKVYFIKDEVTGFIKIGCTKRIPQRFVALKSTVKHPIVVLKLISGEYKLEHSLHKRFAQYRSSGEWFRPSKELMDFIAGLEHSEYKGVVNKGDYVTYDILRQAQT